MWATGRTTEDIGLALDRPAGRTPLERATNRTEGANFFSITEEQVKDLELVFPKDSWLIRYDFPTFEGASPGAIKILRKRLANPVRNQDNLLALRKPVEDLQELSRGSEHSLAELLGKVKDFANVHNRFRRELRILDNKHRGIYVSQAQPYPAQTRPLVAVIQMIGILEDLVQYTSELQSPLFEKVNKKISNFITRPELAPFREDREIVELVKKAPSQYLFQSKEMTLDVAKNHYPKDVFLMRVYEEKDRAELAVELHEERDLSEVAARFNAMIEPYDDLAVTDPEGRHARGFLRHFPEGLITSVLAPLEFSIRIAQMMEADPSYKFAGFDPIGRKTVILEEAGVPSLERHNQGLPLSMDLSSSDGICPLSGATKSGKTVAGKGIAQLLHENQSGLPIRVGGNAVLPIVSGFRSVFPMQEQQAAGAGQFLGLVQQIVDIGKDLTPGTAVFLDEVPAGSNMDELASVAFALVENLYKKGALVFITGHLKDLFQKLEEKIEGVTAFRMKVHRNPDGEVICYEIEEGIVEGSHLTDLMGELGYHQDVVQLSKEYLDKIVEGSEVAPRIEVREITDGKSFDRVQPDRTRVSHITQAIQSLYRLEDFAFYQSFEKLGRLNLDGAALPAQKGITEQHKLFGELIEGRSSTDRFEEVTEVIKEFNQIDMDQPGFVGRSIEQIEKLNGALKDFEGSEAVRDGIRNRTRLAGILRDREKQIEADKRSPSWKEPHGELAGSLIDLDYYLGISKGIVRNELQKPTFVDQPNTFILKDGRPFTEPSNIQRDHWQEHQYGEWVGQYRKWIEPFIRDGVPQSIALTPGESFGLVRGPNGSGKSVLTSSVELYGLMALNGLYVPGDLTLSKFTKVLSYRGGESSTRKGQSYLNSVLDSFGYILQEADEHTLVALEEWHGATHLEIAAAQAAILDILTQRKVTGVFNTHIYEGLPLVGQRPGVAFWKSDFNFDPETNSLTPLFTLSPDEDRGRSSLSYGLQQARALIGEALYQRAREIYEELQ